jgi:hypothetical protein
VTSPGGRLDTIPGGGLHTGPVSGLSTVPVARQNTAQTTDIKRARDIGRATGSKRQPNDDRSDRDWEAGTAPGAGAPQGAVIAPDGNRSSIVSVSLSFMDIYLKRP